jgi:AAA domain, putative AbiEii toxin, Type IV TA system
MQHKEEVMPPKHVVPDTWHLPHISSIAVSGFKSIAAEQTIEIRPLTLLAGANSSGKTSLMQAALLLKQTLEASYDPGPLLLHGSNVRFTSIEQMLFRGSRDASEFVIRIGGGGQEFAALSFSREPGKRLDLNRCKYRIHDGRELELRPQMTDEEIRRQLPKAYAVQRSGPLKEKAWWVVGRDRCFLHEALTTEGGGRIFLIGGEWEARTDYSQLLQDIIHLPGLRGNPVRAYPLTATGPRFPGTFESYTASIVAQWSERERDQLEQLGGDLSVLGLTSKIEAKSVDDTQVELKVGRLPVPQSGGKNDLVNIADVGFGVSQTLPVVVALLVAHPGQLVYIEQPEIHLHPRAQFAMATLIANAANRGVQVVAETHSSLLLLGVQSLVAEGKLSPGKVKLHWFSRNKDGATTITSGDLDETGAFGDWPEDFSDVDLKTESRYIDAAHARLKPVRKHG